MMNAQDIEGAWNGDTGESPGHQVAASITHYRR